MIQTPFESPIAPSIVKGNFMLRFAQIIQRLKTATGWKTESEIEDVFGIERGHLTEHIHENDIPFERLLEISRSLSLDPVWLLFGENGNIGKVKNRFSKFIIVDYFEKLDSWLYEGNMPIYRKIMYSTDIPGLPGSIEVDAIKISTDSMEPTIPKHSIAFVERMEDFGEIEPSKIYIVSYGDGCLSIARLFKSTANRYILKPDNPAYPQLEMESEEFTTKGRILSTIINL